MVPAASPMLAAPERVLEGREAMRWLRSRLRLRPSRTLVAIDGLAGAGKTCFADELADLLSDSGVETLRISLDDYGLGVDGLPEPAHGFVEDVLEPLRSAGSGRYRTAVTDQAGNGRWACAADQAVVLVDGRYLHQAPFHTASGDRVWDLSVWLEVPLACCRERDQSTDPGDAQLAQRYLRVCDPASRADLVVDNRLPHPPID